MVNAARPERVRLPDFSGRLLTISTEPEAWEKIGNCSARADLLLLGTGPANPAALPFVREAQVSGRKIYWLESPATLSLYEKLPEYVGALSNWHKVDSTSIGCLAAHCDIYFYSASRRLDPHFWLPVLGQLEAAQGNLAPRSIKKGPVHTVWLPGNENLLLWRELRQTLAAMGMQVESSEKTADPAKLWPEKLPDFVLSINFRGLDPDGRIFAFCQAMNIPVAIWLVDNPWHLLSAIRLPWWQDAQLFLTDPTFIEGLKTYGGRHVSFCPLAAPAHMWRDPKARAERPPLFVGRSAFPARERFFSGLKLPKDLKAEAEDLVERQAHPAPDFHWWQKKLDLNLWPGREGRLIGLGADFCSMQNRALWLSRMGMNMEIAGDDNWLVLLPGRRIMPPTDYYGTLADMYQSSMATLNVTSWLLPGSLNQRHFDVWAAGGLLLTDKRSGLNLFPHDLAEAISLNCPEEFDEKLAFYRERPALAHELRMEWRELIRKAHGYSHRLRQIMGELALVIPEN